MIRLYEGGNAIPDSTPVKKEDVKDVVNKAKSLLPSVLLKNIQTDIGSAGYKVQSGDIDIMVEATDLVELLKTFESKDPVKEAKLKLKAYFESKGVEANVNGRNVSVGIKYKEKSTGEERTAQVDIMVIHEAALVAPWHQHGLRGMYSDAEFKGGDIFLLISSIAKHLGLKFDPFGAKLLRRDNNEVIGRTRKEVAKILLNPNASEDDLNSVKSILRALENDPDKEGKLAQAKQDAEKGLIKLPGSQVQESLSETMAKLRNIVVENSIQLNEAAPPRIPHPEDAIFHGSAEAEKYLEALKQAIANPKSGSIKWDGSIALYFGYSPENKFFINDKYMPSGFYAYSPQDWERYDTQIKKSKISRPDLYQKLAVIWNGIQKAVGNTKGVFKGDLMAVGNDLKPVNGYYTFEPTTVEYKVPVDSELGKAIGGKAGLIVAHEYDGKPWNGEPAMNPSNVAIITPNVGIDFSLKAPMALISSAEQTLAKYGKSADKFLKGLSPTAKEAIKKYTNHKIIKKTNDDLPEWLSKNISGTQYQSLVGDNNDGYLVQNKQGLDAVIKIWNAIYKLKVNLADQLESQVTGFEQWTEGKRAGEGFVFPTSAGLIKIVNREVFGGAHFNK